MIKQTITEYRIEFLKQFDYYVKNIIEDEDIIDRWLKFGLPDGYNETNLRDIALDDELWLDCVNCFASCCNSEWGA